MILTLGDSFTYGEELTDRSDAWPYVLAREFKRTVDNLAVPSGSNDRMFRLAVGETARSKYDLVIIAWSDPSRFETKVNDEITCVNVARTRPAWLPQFYQHSYDDRLAHERWYTNMLALQMYFKTIGQKYLFCTTGEVMTYNRYYEDFKHILQLLDTRYMTSWPIGGFLSWQDDCPKGDRGHPLELGHKRIAITLSEYIRELELL